MTNFITTAELRNLLNDQTIPDDAATTALIDAATVAIQNWTHQTITQVASDVITLQGTGNRLMFLPQVPVTTVASITLDGVAQVDGTDYTLTRSGILSRFGALDQWTTAGVLVVTYTHGYATIPSPVKLATALLVAELRDPEATTSGALSEEHMGDYGYQIDAAAALMSLSSVRSLLSRYRVLERP